MLEKADSAIGNGESIDTENIGQTRDNAKTK